MKRVIILMFLLQTILTFSNGNLLLLWLQNPSIIPNDKLINLKGKVKKIEGFPESYNILETNYYGFPCYEIIIVDENHVESRLMVKFGRLSYLDYWVKQDSTLSIDEWFYIEKSFMPIIGMEYEFTCVNIIESDPFIDLFPLYSLSQKKNVAGLLVIYKTRI